MRSGRRLETGRRSESIIYKYKKKLRDNSVDSKVKKTRRGWTKLIIYICTYIINFVHLYYIYIYTLNGFFLLYVHYIIEEKKNIKRQFCNLKRKCPFHFQFLHEYLISV